MGYTDTFALGPTLVPIPVASPIQVKPGGYINGWTVKKQAESGGSLSIVIGFSTIAASGYILGNTEVYNIAGPASFWLAAGGATCVAAITASYSIGISTFP